MEKATLHSSEMMLTEEKFTFWIQCARVWCPAFFPVGLYFTPSISVYLSILYLYISTCFKNGKEEPKGTGESWSKLCPEALKYKKYSLLSLEEFEVKEWCPAKGGGNHTNHPLKSCCALSLEGLCWGQQTFCTGPMLCASHSLSITSVAVGPALVVFIMTARQPLAIAIRKL